MKSSESFDEFTPTDCGAKRDALVAAKLQVGCESFLYV